MSLDSAGVLFAVAVLVAIACARLRVPYTVGLVLAGIALAASPFSVHLQLTKELVFSLLLPPLVFEAAYKTKWSEISRDMTLVVSFATVGLVVSIAVVAWLMVWLAGWSIPVAVVFASLISATDPVSVIATMKEAGLTGRLRNLVESESLLNDGTAAVAFGIATAVAMGGATTPSDALIEFARVAIGGVLCGGAVAGLCLLVAGRTKDHLVEIAITTLAAFGSFVIAERMHLSGVLATVTAGLLVGNIGPLAAITSKGHESVENFWEFMAFASNSVVFILIGVQEARAPMQAVLGPLSIAVCAMLAGRFLAVYGISFALARTKYRLKPKYQFVLFWGGLRGALALALAHGLPADFPHRDLVMTVTTGVVAFSILVQGLSMTPILKKAANEQAGAA